MTIIAIATTAFISLTIGTIIGARIERQYQINKWMEEAKKLGYNSNK